MQKLFIKNREKKKEELKNWTSVQSIKTMGTQMPPKKRDE